MRISILTDDPGYGAHAVNCRVRLDGVLQEAALTADEECGEILRYRRDGAGKFVPAGDGFETETVRGKVEIELRANGD